MSLSSIVNVTITKETATVSRVGFGTPLILTYHVKDPALVLEFSSAADMLVAGGGPFAVTDLAYVLANVAFSQSPKPKSILIGRRINATIRTVLITPLSGLVNGETLPFNDRLYRITINGTDVHDFIRRQDEVAVPCYLEKVCCLGNVPLHLLLDMKQITFPILCSNCAQ